MDELRSRERKWIETNRRALRGQWPAFDVGLARQGPISTDNELLFARGFILQVICSAEDFLKHADQLVWHPEMTNECPKCQNPETAAGFGWFNEYGITCEHCRDKRSVPRSCPDTAQPIQKVTLTDDPRDILGWEDEFRLVLRAEDGKQIWKCRKFPGIEFNFPVYGTSNANVPQINPEGGLIVDYESHTQEGIDGFDGW